MIEMWRVKTRYGYSFDRVMADKVTDATVIVGNDRFSMESGYARYFRSKSEAKLFAAEYLTLKAKQAREQMEEIQKHMLELDRME